MPDHFYQAAIGTGADPNKVGLTTATVAGATFEFRIKDGVAGNSKVQAILALEAIKNKLIVGKEIP